MVVHWLTAALVVHLVAAAVAASVAAHELVERKRPELRCYVKRVFLEPKIGSARHNHSRPQVHKQTKMCEVSKWKWTVLSVSVSGRVLVVRSTHRFGLSLAQVHSTSTLSKLFALKTEAKPTSSRSALRTWPFDIEK